jgi:hypothetical protein
LHSLFQVVRDKRTGKTKGYGFVSFSNPTDLAAAIKEMNGLYLNLCSADSVAATCLHVLIYCSFSHSNKTSFRKVCRKLRKSNWKERTDVEALERQKVPICFLLYFALGVPSNFCPYFLHLSESCPEEA